MTNANDDTAHGGTEGLKRLDSAGSGGLKAAKSAQSFTGYDGEKGLDLKKDAIPAPSYRTDIGKGQC